MCICECMHTHICIYAYRFLYVCIHVYIGISIHVPVDAMRNWTQSPAEFASRLCRLQLLHSLVQSSRRSSISLSSLLSEFRLDFITSWTPNARQILAPTSLKRAHNAVIILDTSEIQDVPLSLGWLHVEGRSIPTEEHPDTSQRSSELRQGDV